MAHVMIDLETMALTVDAAVVQIGAVVFDPESGQLGSELSLHVQLDQGRRIDADTVLWWMRQEGARTALLAGQAEAKPLPQALLGFDFWLQTRTPLTVWSHGATFDLPILEHCYRGQQLRVPWGYRAARDTRTVFDLAGVSADGAVDALVGPLVEGELKHDALVDARRQARAVCEAVRRIRRSA